MAMLTLIVCIPPMVTFLSCVWHWCNKSTIRTRWFGAYLRGTYRATMTELITPLPTLEIYEEEFEGNKVYQILEEDCDVGKRRKPLLLGREIALLLSERPPFASPCSAAGKLGDDVFLVSYRISPDDPRHMMTYPDGSLKTMHYKKSLSRKDILLEDPDLSVYSFGLSDNVKTDWLIDQFIAVRVCRNDAWQDIPTEPVDVLRQRVVFYSLGLRECRGKQSKRETKCHGMYMPSYYNGQHKTNVCIACCKRVRGVAPNTATAADVLTDPDKILFTVEYIKRILDEDDVSLSGLTISLSEISKRFRHIVPRIITGEVQKQSHSVFNALAGQPKLTPFLEPADYEQTAAKQGEQSDNETYDAACAPPFEEVRTDSTKMYAFLETNPSLAQSLSAYLARDFRRGQSGATFFVISANPGIFLDALQAASINHTLEAQHFSIPHIVIPANGFTFDSSTGEASNPMMLSSSLVQERELAAMALASDKLGDIEEFLELHHARLFKAHSNITMLRPGCRIVKHEEVTNIPCIVAYVTSKGFVPYDEKQIRIDSFEVDVREGFARETTVPQAWITSDVQKAGPGCGCVARKDPKLCLESAIACFVSTERSGDPTHFLTCWHGVLEKDNRVYPGDFLTKPRGKQQKTGMGIVVCGGKNPVTRNGHNMWADVALIKINSEAGSLSLELPSLGNHSFDLFAGPMTATVGMPPQLEEATIPDRITDFAVDEWEINSLQFRHGFKTGFAPTCGMGVRAFIREFNSSKVSKAPERKRARVDVDDRTVQGEEHNGQSFLLTAKESTDQYANVDLGATPIFPCVLLAIPGRYRNVGTEGLGEAFVPEHGDSGAAYYNKEGHVTAIFTGLFATTSGTYDLACHIQTALDLLKADPACPKEIFLCPISTEVFKKSLFPSEDVEELDA